MKEDQYQLSLSYEQVLSLIRQLPDVEKIRLAEDLERLSPKHRVGLNDDLLKNIFRLVRPHMNHKLGKYTHHKESTDWSFYGLAFTRRDMGYVFGINVGFFRHSAENLYKKAGMNLLVRTNGENPEIRQGLLEFFREGLADWINQAERDFSYPVRGDEGIELARFKDVAEFETEDEIADFIKNSIDGFQKIYPKIVNMPDLFDGIVRAAPKWNEDIVSICKECLGQYNPYVA